MAASTITTPCVVASVSRSLFNANPPALTLAGCAEAAGTGFCIGILPILFFTHTLVFVCVCVWHISNFSPFVYFHNNKSIEDTNAHTANNNKHFTLYFVSCFICKAKACAYKFVVIFILFFFFRFCFVMILVQLRVWIRCRPMFDDCRNLFFFQFRFQLTRPMNYLCFITLFRTNRHKHTHLNKARWE